MLCAQRTFNLKCLLIEFVIPNMSQIYFCIPEIFRTNVLNRFLGTKSPFEFVFSRCEFTKVIVQSKSWVEMFVIEAFWYTNIINYYILFAFHPFMDASLIQKVIKMGESFIIYQFYKLVVQIEKNSSTVDHESHLNLIGISPSWKLILNMYILC